MELEAGLLQRINLKYNEKLLFWTNYTTYYDLTNRSNGAMTAGALTWTPPASVVTKGFKILLIGGGAGGGSGAGAGSNGNYAHNGNNGNNGGNSTVTMDSVVWTAYGGIGGQGGLTNGNQNVPGGNGGGTQNPDTPIAGGIGNNANVGNNGVQLTANYSGRFGGFRGFACSGASGGGEIISTLFGSAGGRNPNAFAIGRRLGFPGIGRVPGNGGAGGGGVGGGYYGGNGGDAGNGTGVGANANAGGSGPWYGEGGGGGGGNGIGTNEGNSAFSGGGGGGAGETIEFFQYDSNIATIAIQVGAGGQGGGGGGYGNGGNGGNGNNGFVVIVGLI